MKSLAVGEEPRLPQTLEAAPAIEVDHLVKRYPRSQRSALDDVSFHVRRGETFGLLGPNGAGKTTAIGILTTRTAASGGRASVAGVDVAADPMGVRQRIGVVPQSPNLDRSLRVREILTYHAAYHGVSRRERTARARALLEELGLGTRGEEKLDWYSGGLQQRVMLGRALMHEPEVLFLDEPTNNLDPQSRLFLWQRIRALRQRGVTVVLTTHDMEEADRLCDRIAIMDRGRVLALDTPEGLRRLIPGGTTLDMRVRPASERAGAREEPIQRALEQLPGVMGVERPAAPRAPDGEAEVALYRLYASEDAGQLLASAAQAVIRERAELLDLRVARSSLEDVFIHLTGSDLRS